VAGVCEYGNESPGSIKWGNFLTKWRYICFSRRTLLHGVGWLFQSTDCYEFLQLTQLLQGTCNLQNIQCIKVVCFSCRLSGKCSCACLEYSIAEFSL